MGAVICPHYFVTIRAYLIIYLYKLSRLFLGYETVLYYLCME